MTPLLARLHEWDDRDVWEDDMTDEEMLEDIGDTCPADGAELEEGIEC